MSLVTRLPPELKSLSPSKNAVKPGIKAARMRDKAWAASLGVFVIHNAGARS